MTPENHIVFEEFPGWGKLLDEFRQTEYFKKSDGKLLDELFYWWLGQMLFGRSNP